MFNKNKKMSLSSKIMIPICIISSIECAFVSIIPIFIYILALFYIDIKNYVTINKKFNIKEYFISFFKNYYLILTIGIVLILLFIILLFITNSFSEFIRQAFYLNTEIYSKYNGYSSNPFKTLIISIPRFIFIIKDYYYQFNINKPMFIMGILIYFGVFLYLIKTIKQNKLLNILLFMFMIACGNRGFIGFHAMPYFSAASIYTLLFIDKLNINIKKLFIVIFTILLCIKFIPKLNNIYINQEFNVQKNKILKKLIKKDEMIMVTVDTTTFININKTSASKFAGMVPWFAEIYENDYLNDIKKEKPNVVLYNPYTDIWGHKYKDFVPKINNYVINNYTYFEKDIWIKNSYVKTAQKIINKKIPSYNNDFLNESNSNDDNNIILNGEVIEEKIISNNNISKISLKYRLVDKNKTCNLNVYVNKENDNIYNSKITLNKKNNSYFSIDLPKQLSSNENYDIKISSNDDNCVILYQYSDELNYDNNYLKINDQEMKDKDLILKLYN